MATSANNEAPSPKFTVGQLVNVAARTWAGINQQGGVGRITGTAGDDSSVVSVKYILDGRHEKEVEVKYVQTYSAARGRLRDRSMLLGRCRNCGSLRTDCGSCDVWVLEQQGDNNNGQSGVNKKEEELNSSTGSSSEGDSSELEEMLEKRKRRERMYRRFKARARRVLHVESSLERIGMDDRTQKLEGEAKDSGGSKTSSSSSSEDDFHLHDLLQSSQIQSTVGRSGHLSRTWTLSSRRDRERRRLSRTVRKRRIIESPASETSEVMASPTPMSVSSPGTEESSDGTDQTEGTATARDFAHVGSMSETLSFVKDNESEDNIREDEFIQPEGNALVLPTDIQDKTKGLKFQELALFFDETADELQNSKIPSAKTRVLGMEREWKDLSSRDDKNSFQARSELVYDELIQDLVRDGLDQCQASLRKLSNKRLFKLHKDNLKPEERERKLDARSFRLDALSEAVEELVAKILNLLRSAEFSGDEDMGGVDESDGWADPSEESPVRAYGEVESPRGTTHAATDLQPFDRHAHARTKRRYRENSRGRHRGKASGAPPSCRPRRSVDNGQADAKGHSNKHRRKKRKKARYSGEGSGERSARTRLDIPSVENFSSSFGSDTDHILPSSFDGFLQDEVGNSSEEDRTTRQHNQTVDAANSDKRRRTKRRKARDSGEGSGEKRARARQETSSVESVSASFGSDTDHTLPSNFYGFLQDDVENSPEEARIARQNKQTVDAATRMRRFLDANAGNNLEVTTPRSLATPKSSRRKRRRLRRRSGQSRNRDNQAPPSSFTDTDHQDQAVLQRALFSALSTRSANNQSVSHETRSSCATSLSELCSLLVDRYPELSCKRVIRDIVTRAEESDLDAHERNTIVFDTIVQVLHKHGSETIQSFVSRECPILATHICLLAASLDLIKLGLNRSLQPEDGIVYELFSPMNCDQFVDLVHLQLVDSVYSLVHPSAWNLSVRNRDKIFSALNPLRTALSRHMHLAERACRCVLNELESQRWFKVCGSGQVHAYVSCVDPSSWSSFLLTGGPLTTPSPDAIRFSAFHGHLPRCEIDALWSLLAYFSTSASTVDDSHTSYWQMISKMFLYGVLPTDTECGLPPSDAHLAATTKEIRNLTQLLTAGTIGALPRSDTILVNLLHRSLLLQADDYLEREESRLAAYPCVQNEKKEKRSVAKFWSELDGICEPVQMDVSPVGLFTLSKALTDSDTSHTLLGQPLLLPSSAISRSCVGLLAAWIINVPLKKARRSRLSNALNSLVKKLVDAGPNLENRSGDERTSSSTENDPFQAAFSLPAPTRGGVGSMRRELFLREASAYITIVSRIIFNLQSGSSNQNVMSLSERVWELLADEIMRKHQEELVGSVEKASLPLSYDQDGLRLYLAAKAISFLALSFLGYTPWKKDLPSPVFSLLFPAGETENSNDLFFLFSCLSTCLDCTCDIPSSVDVMTLISSMMGIVLRRIRQILCTGYSNMPWLEPSMHNLCANLFKLSLSTLRRCLGVVLSASYCGVEEELCFEALLSMLKGVVFVAKSHSAYRDNARNDGKEAADAENRDELWGDLDDEAFASLLDESEDNDKQAGDGKALTDIWDFLIESLDQAKPSKRFLITQPNAHSPPGTTTMTPQGRTLVGRHVDAVCRSLVALAEFDGVARAEMLLLKMASTTRVGAEEVEGDLEYNKKVAQCITRELSSVAPRSTHMLQVLRQNPEHAVLNLFEGFLDLKSLEKLPTCNLNRIRSRSGDAGEKREFTNLLRVADGTKTSAKDVAHDLWKTCISLGRLLGGEDDATDTPGSHTNAGRWLIKLDPDLTAFQHSISSLSIEKECLDRFRLFRGIISHPPVYVEHLSAVLLASTASELLRLTKMLQIHDHAREDTAQNDYEGAKLFEVFSCYSELHVSLLAWTFREASQCRLVGMHQLRDKICGQYLAPLVRREAAVDLSANFAWIVSDSLAVVNGNGGLPSSDVGALRQTDASTYAGALSDSIIRRSREFMIHIAKAVANQNEQASVLFGSLLLAGANQSSHEAWTVSRSFCSKAYLRSSMQDNIPKSSPLQSEIDNYLSHVEEIYPIAKDDVISLLKLKRQALHSVVPRLSRDWDEQKKPGILRFLRFMMEMEHGESTNIDSSPRMELVALCSLARGIRISLQKTLASRTINEDLAIEVYLCAKSLANLPAACVDRDAVGWLIDWSSCHKDKRNGSREASYLWAVFIWLKDLGVLIFDNGQESLDKLGMHRADLRRMMKSSSSDTSSIASSAELISWTAMMSMEEEMFGRQENTTAIVTNVYASRRGVNAEDGAPVRWMPTTHVRRAVNTFVTKILQTDS